MNAVSEAALDRLHAAKGFIFDMDGTLVLADPGHNGADALRGAAETIRHLRQVGTPFVVFTNGTVKPPAALAKVLQAAGLPVAVDQVMTPSTVAAEVLKSRGCREVMMIAPEPARTALTEAGLSVFGSNERRSVDAVYVAWNRDFTMIDIENACHAIWGGAQFLVGSMHPHYMTTHGRALGTSRAIAAAIASLTSKRPLVTGKPSRRAMKAAARRLGVDASDVVVVGDDAELEISMARRSGAFGVLLQTGVTGKVPRESLAEACRPDLQLPDVHALLDLLAPRIRRTRNV